MNVLYEYYIEEEEKVWVLRELPIKSEDDELYITEEGALQKEWVDSVLLRSVKTGTYSVVLSEPNVEKLREVVLPELEQELKDVQKWEQAILNAIKAIDKNSVVIEK